MGSRGSSSAKGSTKTTKALKPKEYSTPKQEMRALEKHLISSYSGKGLRKFKSMYNGGE